MKFLAGTMSVGALLAPSVQGNLMSAEGQRIKQMKLDYWGSTVASGLKRASVLQDPATCVDGSLQISGESFPCDNVDFLSYLSLGDMAIPDHGGVYRGTDIWGWVSESGQEITLWTTNNGIWFVDSTDPLNPLRLGYSPDLRGSSGWSDVKTVGNFAWFGKDNINPVEESGILGFDLTKLAGLPDDPTNIIVPDTVYDSLGDSHNIISNNQAEMLYACGGNLCSGGLYMMDVSDPLDPEFVGCVDGDGYTHDAQCVIYDGPDDRFTGQEICFAFNEDSLTIWDVTNKTAPEMLSRATYIQSSYTHQGWLTKDLNYVLLDDETDELGVEVDDPEATTVTYLVDVSSLTDAFFADMYHHDAISIDHNLYVWGSVHEKGWGGSPPMENPPNRDYAYLSNYVSGLKILDTSDIANIKQVGYFDCAPDKSGNIFDGTWSNYLHPSGVMALSSIDRGLFFLQPNMVFDEEVVVTDAPGQIPTSFPTDPPFTPPTAPDGWLCSPNYYDAADGCDCGCGGNFSVPDPDCELDNQQLYGCPDADAYICVNAFCELRPTDEPTASPTFTPTDSPVGSPVTPTNPPVEPPVTPTNSPVESPITDTTPPPIPDFEGGSVYVATVAVLGLAVLILVALIAVLLNKSTKPTAEVEVKAGNAAGI